MSPDKKKDKLEEMMEAGPQDDSPAWTEDIIKRFVKLEAGDQAELAERMVSKKSSEIYGELIERTYKTQSVSLSALLVLGRALAGEQKADESTLETMERWKALCEEQEQVEAPELFTLPENVQTAVIDHLARWLRTDLLSGLAEAAPDKFKAKMVKKALHQARSSGADLDESAGLGHTSLEQEQAVEKKDEAYIAPPDSTGTFLVYFYRTVFDKNNLFVVIANDLTGVLRLENYLVPDHKFRAILESTQKNPYAVLVKTDPAFARYLVKRAEQEGEKRGHAQDTDFLSSRRMLGVADQEEVPHPLWEQFSEDELRGEAGLVNRSQELLDCRIFEDWSLGPEDEWKLLMEIKSIDESPLDLTDAQKEQRKKDVFEQEASWILSSEGRHIWRGRLLLCAYIQHLLEEPEDAKMTAAVALATEDAQKPVPPFFVELMSDYMEETMEDEKEDEPSGPDFSRGGIVKT